MCCAFREDSEMPHAAAWVGTTGPVIRKMARCPILISVDGRARLPDAPSFYLKLSILQHKAVAGLKQMHQIAPEKRCQSIDVIILWTVVPWLI